MNRYLHIMALIALFLLSACEKQGEEIDPAKVSRAELRSIEYKGHLTVPQIREVMGKDAFVDSLAYDSKLKYEVNYYKLTYYTDYEGKMMVPAEALLLIPTDAPKTRLAVYFHGTVLPISMLTDVFSMGAPSTFDGSNGNQDIRQCGLPLASSGFCVIMPDYVGYGLTEYLDHPFVYYPELAKSAMDGVVCAQKLIKDDFIAPSDKKLFGSSIKNDPGMDLWMCGWSQGAGMSMYAQREIEEGRLYSYKFNVKANSMLAGPFNVERFVMNVLENPDKPLLMIMLYSWFGYSYNRFCPALKRPFDQMFRPKIVDQEDAFMVFGSTPRDLFTGFFIQHVVDGTDKAFLNALKETRTDIGWVPKAPIYMHHGAADIVVPCFNSEDAYKGLHNDDPEKNKAHLYLYKGENHGTFVPTYMSKTIEAFQANL